MKKILSILLIFALLFSAAGCRRSLNYIIGHKPHFTAVVEEVRQSSILVTSEDMQGYPFSVQVDVQLDVEYGDSMTEFQVGDTVTVYYDGSAMETDPLQLATVYAILLLESADRSINENP